MTAAAIAALVCGIVGGVLLIFAFVWLNNNLLLTTRRKIKYGGITTSVKIVHLSDLHGKTFGRRNRRLIAKVAAQQPDIIAFTGDAVHRYTEKNKRVALETVSALAQIAPVIYVSGNHEMRNKGYRFFRRDLMEAGATVLDNQVTEIAGLTIVGLNCASLKNGTIDRVTPQCENMILLAHMPHFFESYVKAGYDLVLCGHAHGGQWRIPFTGIGVYAPGQGWFPKYTAGVHGSGKTKMIVSRGLGNSQCPLRIFNPPEIVTVTLEP